MEPRDVDGLGVTSFSLAPDRAIDLAVRLGLRPRWLMDGTTGGAAALDMLQHARRVVARLEAEPGNRVRLAVEEGALVARRHDDRR